MKDNDSQMSLDKVLYCFWLSDNQMSDRRQKSLQMLRRIGLETKFITTENLHEYINEPLHQGYQYLSSTHKSDYLRCYFMHFYGGAYADIKPPTAAWDRSVDELRNSDKWFMGFLHHTVSALGMGVDIMPEFYGHFFGDQGFICKSQTPFTSEWYSGVISAMDKNLDSLKSHKKINSDKYRTGPDYPFRIGELLMEIIYPLWYKYREKTLSSLPPLNCEAYL